MASNGPRSKIALLLRLSGLSGLEAFVPATRVFSAVELGRFKPDPALFLHAAAAMGVAPAECVGQVHRLTRLADLLDQPWNRPA